MINQFNRCTIKIEHNSYPIYLLELEKSILYLLEMLCHI